MSKWPLIALALLSGCAQPPVKPQRFYVSVERGNSVAIIDPVSGAVLQRIAVGRRPRGILASPDGALLYVAVSGSPIGGPGVDEDSLPPSDKGADGIAVIDLATGKILRTLNSGSDPETFARSADGRTLFVSNEDVGAISAVAADGSGAPRTVKVGEEPEGIAVTPDGQHLFVACEAADHVAMLDAKTLRMIRTIPIAGRPRTLLAARDGSMIFVAIESGGRLALLDARTGEPAGMIDLARGDAMVRPMGLAEAPDGHLLITTGRGGAVLEVDPRKRAIVRTIDGVGQRPWGIALSADARTIATANGPSDDVTLIDRATGKIVRRIKIGPGPWGVAR